MADTSVRLGRLRWPVTVAQRVQQPDPVTEGIAETLVPIAIGVHADIQPVKAVTFYGSIQVDAQVTHRITLRYLSYPDNSMVILRTTRTPNGAQRTEIFRVRRVAEVDGRKRFIECECDLEKVENG